MSDQHTNSDKVKLTLEKIFQQHRLIFWYDEQAEMKDLFDDLSFENIGKLVIDKNEFGLKYHVLIEEPTKSFLIYKAGEKPEDHENWLLDLELSNYEFHTEPASLVLQELEWPLERKSIINEHEAFFTNAKRKADLKSVCELNDQESLIRTKMLSIAVGSEPEWEKALYALFDEAYRGKQERYKAAEKFNLTSFLWSSIQQKYGYQATEPSLKDLLFHLLQNSFNRSISGMKPELNKEAYLFVNRWKESSKARKLYKDWSTQFESDLNIESSIQLIPTESLLEADAYAIIDKKICLELRNHIIHNTLPNHTIQEWVERRRIKFFYEEFAHIYEALSKASMILDEIRKVNLSIESPKEGFDKYTKHWHRIDKYYRNYIYASGQAEHQSLLKELTLHIEKAYSNSYLLPLGDNWQKSLDKIPAWTIDRIESQRQFYVNWVAPYLKTENRVFVIISDALRYETAVELREIILQEDRYAAELTAVLGSLPSYTQLGMASLLPHQRLSFEDKSDIVYADGISSQGTSNRTKILQKTYPGSIAISAEDFLKMKSNTEGREFIKPYNVLYIYSNHIDKTGDDKMSEHKVFEATETEFQYLLKIIKQISNMNGTNMIITADHGYLYQHNRLEETDFTDFTPTGDIYRSNRRFVIGKNLDASAAVQKWSGEQLGLEGDIEILIPKSINRIKIQGAGSRFVHGGSSLQEIVIPILEINKARKSDIERVEVDVISRSPNITSNTFGVIFYQTRPVNEKLLPRKLRTGFFTSSGQKISDLVTILFNSTDSDSAAREKRQTYIFSNEANNFNAQDVYLRMDELIEGTNQYKEYKKITYRMMIAIRSEFDEF